MVNVNDGWYIENEYNTDNGWCSATTNYMSKEKAEKYLATHDDDANNVYTLRYDHDFDLED